MEVASKRTGQGDLGGVALLWHELKAVARFRNLIRYLVAGAMKRENSGTVLGYVWWVLDPLLLMAVYVVLVKVMLGHGDERYPVFVFSSVLAWKFFASSVRQSMGQVTSKQRLMKRVAFPRSVLPISAAVAGILRFAFGLVVLIVFAVPFGVYPHATLALLPLVVAVELALLLGLAFFLSALNVFVRDIGNIVGPTFRLWFYLSPGLYSVASVPEDYRTLYNLNPFATIFPAYRDILIYHDIPDLAALAAVGGASVVVLALGYAFFVNVSHQFTKAY